MSLTIKKRETVAEHLNISLNNNQQWFLNPIKNCTELNILKKKTLKETKQKLAYTVWPRPKIKAMTQLQGEINKETYFAIYMLSEIQWMDELSMTAEEEEEVKDVDGITCVPLQRRWSTASEVWVTPICLIKFLCVHTSVCVCVCFWVCVCVHLRVFVLVTFQGLYSWKCQTHTTAVKLENLQTRLRGGDFLNEIFYFKS